jgi:acetolactate synthase-1/2/3 large subunit
MGTIRGDQIIAQCFKNEGVDTFFFMMGGPTSGTAGASLDLGMQGIYVRHEQAAAMMAHCLCSCDWQTWNLYYAFGAGDSECRDGISECLGGRFADRRNWWISRDARNDAGFVSRDGSSSVMKPVVKAASSCGYCFRGTCEDFEVAFREAMDGKKGPVYLDLPGDILSAKVDDEKLYWPENYRVDARPAGDPTLVKRAIDLLAKAQRPLLVTGSGVLWSGATAELRQFVEATGIPFFTTPQGRGVIPEDHPVPSLLLGQQHSEKRCRAVIGARANAISPFLRAPRFSRMRNLSMSI